jgi:hypothetical protein
VLGGDRLDETQLLKAVHNLKWGPMNAYSPLASTINPGKVHHKLYSWQRPLFFADDSELALVLM